jgi:hypothetical protein
VVEEPVDGFWAPCPLVEPVVEPVDGLWAPCPLVEPDAAPCCCLRPTVGPNNLQTPDSKVYAMQDGFPLHAARQAARSSTAGVAIGAGEPAGTELMGLA